MKKLFIFVLLIVLQFFGVAEPAFAGLPYGFRDASWHPNYRRQMEYIKENSCDAAAMIPYSGRVFYTCSNGQQFWAEVLVPTESSPLFMYFKNRKKQDDENSDDTVETTTTATTSSFGFN